MSGKSLIPAVGYLRRSTDKQEASIPDQQKAVEHYAAEHGYAILRWYTDDGISGDDTAKRLEFLRMLADAQRVGDFKAILCWQQDRFGRFTAHEGSFLTYPLSKAGVQLVTTDKGPIDWSDFTDWLTYSVNQHGKHEFLKDLGRNVARGQLGAAVAGSWVGQPPYAYRIVGEHLCKRLVLDDPTKARVVKRVFREFVEDGRPMLNIANRLNAEGIPSPGGNVGGWRFDTVRTILANPAYTGDYCGSKYSYGKYHTAHRGSIVKANGRCCKPEAEWIVHADKHEAIIDRSTFTRAKAILAKGKTGRSPHTPENNPFILSGKLRCGICGSVMYGVRGGGSRYRYYECGRRAYNGKDPDKLGQTCPGTTVREDRILHEIADELDKQFLELDGDRLAWKAHRKELTAADLAGSRAFAKLKRMIVGPRQPAGDRQRAEKRAKEVAGQLDKARRNLVLLDADNIPLAQERIRQLAAEHETLTLELRKKPPSEQDINADVLTVLKSLCWIGWSFRSAAQEHAIGDDFKEGAGKRPGLRIYLNDIDVITVRTRIEGKGTRRRHAFLNGDIAFRPVGGVANNSNPHLIA